MTYMLRVNFDNGTMLGQFAAYNAALWLFVAAGAAFWVPECTKSLLGTWGAVSVVLGAVVIAAEFPYGKQLMASAPGMFFASWTRVVLFLGVAAYSLMVGLMQSKAKMHLVPAVVSLLAAAGYGFAVLCGQSRKFIIHHQPPPKPRGHQPHEAGAAAV